MPIRWRLTLGFSLILSIILVLSGTVLYALLQHYLNIEVDNSLALSSARVHGTLSHQTEPATLDYDVIHSRLPPINEFASPGIYIQLMDRQGAVVMKSDNLGDQELPVDPLLIEEGFRGNVGLATVAAGSGLRVRIMASPLYLREETLVLEVAESLRHFDAVMAQARIALVASIFLAFVLAGVAGMVLVRRALVPVGRITETARNIEAGSDLSQRVGYGGPQDEIGRLATTFDHMLGHLDRAFESQKRFVADASHELRNPLTVIQGNVDLLKRDLGEADRTESLHAIDAETVRMAKIINDLLLLAEIEASEIEHREKVSLRGVLLAEFRRAGLRAKRHNIVIARQEDLWIEGDAYRLQQSLSNLVDNAIRYTPEGGTIRLSLFRDGGWACLEVADTGIGIPAEHLPLIFDRFYRVDKARSRARGGTGLGLAIVRRIAEQHGGKVTVTSEPGRGSVFTVWLQL